MHNSILSAYQFSLLMGTLLFLEAISLYGENTFTSVENQCLLLEKTLTFVQTTATGWQQPTGCSSPSSSSPQCSFLLWVSSTNLQTFFQALSEDLTSNQNKCPPIIPLSGTNLHPGGSSLWSQDPLECWWVKFSLWNLFCWQLRWE